MLNTYYYYVIQTKKKLSKKENETKKRISQIGNNHKFAYGDGAVIS